MFGSGNGLPDKQSIRDSLLIKGRCAGMRGALAYLLYQESLFPVAWPLTDRDPVPEPSEKWKVTGDIVPGAAISLTARAKSASYMNGESNQSLVKQFFHCEINH